MFRKQKLRKKIFITDPHKELLKRIVQAKGKMIPDGSAEMLEWIKSNGKDKYKVSI